MITKSRLEEIVPELMKSCRISPFSVHFLETSAAGEDEIRKSLSFLRKKGVPDEDIAYKLHLLSFSEKKLAKRMKALRQAGLPDDKIMRNSYLLCLNSRTVKRRFSELEKIGLGQHTVFLQPMLLGMKAEKTKMKIDALVERGVSREYLEERPYLFVRKTETLMENWAKLNLIGFSDEKIAEAPHLLSRKPETIRKRVNHLIKLGVKKKEVLQNPRLLRYRQEYVDEALNCALELGLTRREALTAPTLLTFRPKKIKEHFLTVEKLLGLEVIKKRPMLLTRNQESVLRKYEMLANFGINAGMIRTLSHFLLRNESKLISNYETLVSWGLAKEKVNRWAPLIGRDCYALRQNYIHHLGLLSEHGRESEAREFLLSQPQLIGISKQTMLANVQYAGHLGFQNRNAFFLGTKTRTKRERMAWVLREVFGYRNCDDKRAAIQDTYAFIRSYPYYMSWTKKKLEGKKQEMIRISDNYRTRQQ